ncbi:hypothetical protein DP106_13355 [Halonotius pteroides]|uniref:Uncharacterized protein n=1 Tax=Halonotius pteroides TaxID=268735 RepID=A0A3A6Q2F8_9EURY|nr:hypothetical protein DP106_13355 [Halonotius pteroides]
MEKEVSSQCASTGFEVVAFWAIVCGIKFCANYFKHLKQQFFSVVTDKQQYLLGNILDGFILVFEGLLLNFDDPSWFVELEIECLCLRSDDKVFSHFLISAQAEVFRAYPIRPSDESEVGAFSKLFYERLSEWLGRYRLNNAVVCSTFGTDFTEVCFIVHVATQFPGNIQFSGVFSVSE